MKRLLNIEVSSVCQLTCPSCPVGRRETGNGRLMDFAMFRDIVNKAMRECEIDCVHLYLWGEPTLNDDLPRMVEFCRDLNLRPKISTNLQSTRNLEQSMLSGLNEICVSCSGWSQETYGTTHHGNFARFRSNLAELVQIKHLNNFRTRLILRWHRYRHNGFEERAAMKFCKRNEIAFEPQIAVWLPLGSLIEGPQDLTADLLLVPPKQGLAIASRLKTHCQEHDSLQIGASGDVKLCCPSFSHSVGNFLDIDLATLDERRRTHSFCSTCINSGALGYFRMTNYRLLWIALRNEPCPTVKLRIFLEMIAHMALSLGRIIPLPLTMNRRIVLSLKHRI